MPTKRNRKDSESSNCSLNGVLEIPAVSIESPSVADKCDVENGNERAWLRPCCTPMGCVVDGGQVNLTKPDEIGKVVCSSENCSVGPYMHKECFRRWEDGLLTYLRSHGRARSWSEKQRRQNLWTKRGYDLAYRACVCKCGRGHLRKDLNWNPKDITLPNELSGRDVNEEATKKRNRKKHKDLPSLGNKYTVAVARSKSKAIPPSGRDGRARTNSGSSSMSIDQGYSSSSPSNSDSHVPFAGGFFSPPQHHTGRTHISNNHRIVGRGLNLHGSANPLFSHVSLPQIPDNDILEDFCEQGVDYSYLYGAGNPSSLQSQGNGGNMSPRFFATQQMNAQSPAYDAISPSTPELSVSDIGRMFRNMNMSTQRPQRQRCHSWSDPYEASPNGSFNFKEEPLSWCGKSSKNASKFFHGSLDIVPENSAGVPFSIGHWGDTAATKPTWDSHHQNDKESCPCPNSSDSINQMYLDGIQGFPNPQTMLCCDIDLKKPKVIIIPGNGPDKRTCTEITITPMCNTIFHKRYDFSGFQCILQANQVNPYHIKMEGEGYGSDDFRNTILAKLSKEKCSQIECVACGKLLLIYDHFPLLDGTLFFSPLQTRIGTSELKIEIENKTQYLHALCVGCIDGANNLFCVMCEKKWKGPFHQLGSMYMFDIFAATPCCQSRLRCKQCGYTIVDISHGMKFFSQYSEKVSCPSCGTFDYHFVHPASTFKVFGPDKYPLF